MSEMRAEKRWGDGAMAMGIKFTRPHDWPKGASAHILKSSVRTCSESQSVKRNVTSWSENQSVVAERTLALLFNSSLEVPRKRSTPIKNIIAWHQSNYCL